MKLKTSVKKAGFVQELDKLPSFRLRRKRAQHSVLESKRTIGFYLDIEFRETGSFPNYSRRPVPAGRTKTVC